MALKEFDFQEKKEGTGKHADRAMINIGCHPSRSRATATRQDTIARSGIEIDAGIAVGDRPGS
jgi:hypothetical protein